MKILYIMNNEKRHESIQTVSYMLYKKDNMYYRSRQKKVITVYLRKHYEYRRNKLCLLNMLKDIIVQSTLKGKREDNNKKEEKT